MSRSAWRATFGRFVAATLAFAVLAAVATFARPPVADYPKVRVVISQATDANTGLDVTRPEWLEKASS